MNTRAKYLTRVSFKTPSFHSHREYMNLIMEKIKEVVWKGFEINTLKVVQNLVKQDLNFSEVNSTLIEDVAMRIKSNS